MNKKRADSGRKTQKQSLRTVLSNHAVWPLLAVVVFAVLLGVVLHLREAGQDEEPEAVVEALWTAAPEDLRAVSPTFADGEALSIEQRDGEYWLTQPGEFPADRQACRTLFEFLAEPRPLRLVEETGEGRLDEFGLDNPYGVVAVDFKDGTSRELLIGAESPVSAGESPNRYALVSGSTTVYLLSGPDIQFMNRGLADWRDRDILKLDVDAVRRVEVWQGEEAASNFTLQRNETPADDFAWLISTDDYQAPGQTESIRDFLTALAEVQVEEFVDDDPEDLAEYGLAPGHMRFRFEHAGELGDATLYAGSFADTKGQMLYVKTERWPFVYTINTSLFSRANPNPHMMLEKQLLSPVPAAELLSLTWDPREGERITVSRTSTTEEVGAADWQLQVGSGDSDGTDAEKVASLAEQLLELNALDIQVAKNPGEYGHQPPAGTISVSWSTAAETADPMKLTLVVGTKMSDQVRYLALDGYDVFYEVSEADVAAVVEAFAVLVR